jgi:phage terminase large subunit-like protein
MARIIKNGDLIDSDFVYSGPDVIVRDWHNLPNSELTRGERNCKFIESYCIIPEGEHVGKPVKLADFQVIFILAIYDNINITDTAILSIARKNAKTGTIAFIVNTHLVGPEARLNSRIISGAMSREQAGEVFNLAAKCIRLSPKLSAITRIVDSSKKIIGLNMNVEYQAISAEGKTAHGKSPVLAILDEVGQITGPQSDFVDAVTTAQAAYEDPLLIYISTQAATDADFFSIQIDDAMKNKPKKTVCHVYAADKDGGLLDEEQWKKANPALGLFRSEKDMRKQAEKANRMPSFENTFRNLNLNQRVSLVSPFVSRSIWEANGGKYPEFNADNYIWFGGLDLSARTDLTSFVLYGLSHDPDVNHIVIPFFWTPSKGLKDREKKDRQPYSTWVKDGFLKTTQGATVDYDDVVEDIFDMLEVRDIQIHSIGFDRWRIDVFKAACERKNIDWNLVPVGQGFKDMSPALDALEALLLNSKIRHSMHPVLTMCAANAVVTKDAAGGRKLDKSKTNGRIDGMVALAMAVSVSNGHEEEVQIDFDNLLTVKL